MLRLMVKLIQQRKTSTMRSWPFQLVSLFFLVLSVPAEAIDFYERRGGWEVIGSEESCGMTMEYEGSGATTLVFLKFADGMNAMSVTNSGWTAEKGVEYDITYKLADEEFGGGATIGTTRASSSGFISRFSDEFEQSFRKASTLHIFLKDVRIDQLSLAGSSMALDSVNRCVVLLKAEQAKAKAEVDRLSHIPKDPFALVRGPAAPMPRGNPGSWVTLNDFPASALREQRAGRVDFTLTVGNTGLVIDCVVTASSGHADLDAATCANVRRRARFKPGTGTDGQPIEGTWSSSVNWSIPSQ